MDISEEQLKFIPVLSAHLMGKNNILDFFFKLSCIYVTSMDNFNYQIRFV